MQTAIGQTARGAAQLSGGSAGLIPLVAMLHLALGVDLALLPATFGLAADRRVLHRSPPRPRHRLRPGGLLLPVILSVLLTSDGGLYPIDVVSAPFQALSPLLPLTGAVAGMQAILTGAGPKADAGGGLQLAGYAVAAFAVAALVTAGRRSTRSLELVPAAR